MSIRTQKKERRWFWLGKSTKNSVTVSDTGKNYWLEMRREGKRNRSYLCRTEKILKYSDTESMLLVSGETICFYGMGLSLASYRAGIVEVMGKFRKVVFGRESE